MVTKLSQCQYALPLLVPDPFTQQIEFPLWTFRQIHKSWNILQSTNSNGVFLHLMGATVSNVLEKIVPMLLVIVSSSSVFMGTQSS